MDIVVLTTVAAHATTALIDKLESIRDSRATVSQAQSSVSSSLQLSSTPSSTITNNETVLPPSSETSTPSPAPPQEGSIAELELRLARLRDEAKALNSPDSFVQYAQRTREANRVAKELADRRAAEGVADDDGLNFEQLANWLSGTVGVQGASVARAHMRGVIIKSVVRTLLAFGMWLFFRSDSRGGEVMRVSCSMIRPLTFLTRRVSNCREDDWTCVAENGTECVLGSTLTMMVAGVGVSTIRDILTANILSRQKRE